MPQQPPVFKPAHYRTREQRLTEYDKSRGTTAERGYGGAWQRARKSYLMAHPVCVKCSHPANEVDHIIPHRGNQALFWESSNWQSLCKPCHSAKTAQEGGARG